MAHELILGGARSGKSRAAEARAAQWLAAPGQQAVLIATAWAGDGEMALRIARHQADRAVRVPRLGCLELHGGDLAQALLSRSTPQRLGVETRQFVDALGWLHQEVAAACAQVTLMVAGCELAVKSPAREPAA